MKMTCGYITPLFFTFLFCSAANGFVRSSEILPEAKPKISYVINEEAVANPKYVNSGQFAKLQIKPKINNGDYWQPTHLLQAADELNKMLPPEFINRFAVYYGINRKTNHYQRDDDLEERLVDLDRYLIDIWQLTGHSQLAKQFQCLGIYDGDLSNFYVLWAGRYAQNNKLLISKGALKEFDKMKSHLSKLCGVKSN